MLADSAHMKLSQWDIGLFVRKKTCDDEKYVKYPELFQKMTNYLKTGQFKTTKWCKY